MKGWLAGRLWLAGGAAAGVVLVLVLAATVFRPGKPAALPPASPEGAIPAGTEQPLTAASHSTPGIGSATPGGTPAPKGSAQASRTPGSGAASGRTATPTAAAKQETTYSADGRGTAVSESLGLEKGWTTFHLIYNENTPFVVELVDQQSGAVDQLINTTGPYDGTTASSISAAGTYVLSVQSAAEWSAVVSQPDFGSQPGVKTQSGHGDGVVYLALPAGSSTLHLHGSAGFNTYLYNSSGQKKPLLSQKGPYDGTVSESAGGKAGVFAVVIQTTGDWSLEVQ